MNSCALLRHLLKTECPLIMPDAFDGLSARLIELSGFKAVQCSGYSIALAAHAIPETRLSFEKNLEITRDIVQSVKIPVMADGEDGFGPPSRVFETVGAYLDAGVAGINIEDQILPPSESKGVINRSLMKDKIRAAREAGIGKDAANFVLNARTDSLKLWPDRKNALRESIERGNEYLEAGADLIFVVGVSTLEETKELVREIHGPVSIAAGMPYNIGSMSIQDLRELGVSRVSLPTIAVHSMIQAVKRTLSIIHSGSFDEVMEQGLLCGMEEVSSILARG
jgi:2-methylisocitrate lyase-like PEP mutase family enzyme